ncbi:MAG: sn-glycerol-1-phosphate dehydrogenase [Clostridia bacterium]|nr:sn-glycerol-1-phosphate dehydrogenase [Clostridia bacterium]
MSFILDSFNTTCCPCGKEHLFSSKVITGSGAITRLPDLLDQMQADKLYLLADKNTYAAAGEAVVANLKGRKYHIYIFDKDALEPDEASVGLAIMHYRPCDAVLAIGSGVINDIGKIVAATASKPYIIVGTAPSMDGYASSTSSMTVDGLKTSLNSKCADVIIGDTDILASAPIKMMASGIGDMLAKYVSICEWRISHLINGEYYCPEIARLVRDSLNKCVRNAEGLMKREPAAVEAVFEGLVVCGVAMKYAGLSRPASGVEHYLSHVWDMRGAELGIPTELHGVQCAYGTLLAVRLYNKLVEFTPDRDKALAYTSSFDLDAWHATLSEFLGRGAKSMIELEKKEDKYSLSAHKKRLEKIIEEFDTIKRIISQELPSPKELESLLKMLGLPTSSQEAGVDQKILQKSFFATRDIRDKYVLSRLAWDLGIPELALELNNM